MEKNLSTKHIINSDIKFNSQRKILSTELYSNEKQHDQKINEDIKKKMHISTILKKIE